MTQIDAIWLYSSAIKRGRLLFVFAGIKNERIQIRDISISVFLSPHGCRFADIHTKQTHIEWR